MLKAHESGITHMQWFEKDRMLITSAKEKCIKVSLKTWKIPYKLFIFPSLIFLYIFKKFWKLPEEWRDSKVEREEERENEIRKETQNILKFQKKQQQERF